MSSPSAVARPTLAELLSVPPVLGSPFTRSQLGSDTAWDALRRDGDLVEVRDGWAVAAGTPVTPSTRAASLGGTVPRDVVVGRATAAWVHTGFPRPGRVCVLYSPGGYRPRSGPLLEVAQATVRPWELERVGALTLTSPVRTALDVATWCPEDEVQPILRALLRHGVVVDEALARLRTFANWRGAGRARTRLEIAGAAGDPVRIRR